MKTQAEGRKATMARLARVLRAEGFIPTDRDTGSLLLAFARAGVFRLGGTLAGTAAYALYQGELGVRFDSEDLARTGDIDFASLRAAVGLVGWYRRGESGRHPSGPDLRSGAGVAGSAGLKWRQSRGEALVEFLTPAFGEEARQALPALGVSAQGLNYLIF